MKLRYLLVGIFLVCVLGGAIASCGAPKLPDAGFGVLGGPSVKVATDPGRPEPWLLEWGADTRRALATQVASGIALVRYVDGEIELLQECTAPGSYTDGGAMNGRPRETKEITSTSELYAMLGIKIVEASAGFERGEHWMLDYVVADVRSTGAATVDKSTLSGRCANATHFVERIYTGAYILNTGGVRRTIAEVKVPVAAVDAAAGSSTGGTAQLVTSDGDLVVCANLDTDRMSFACAGILKIGLAPL